MGWSWKVAEVCRGDAERGSLGRIFGATLQRWFVEKSGNTHRADPDAQLQESLTILYGLTAYMVYVAKADGNFHKKERNLIHRICVELSAEMKTGLNDADIENLIEMASESKQAIPHILELAQDDDKLRYALLRYGWRIAARDGRITSDEFQKIVSLAKEMGASSHEMVATSAPYYRPQGDHATRAAALETLELPPQADLLAIEQKYKGLTLKYHPDLYQGVSVDIKALIEEKFAIISRAYAELVEQNKERIYYGKIPGDTPAKTASARQGDVILCYFCHGGWRLPQQDFRKEDLRCGSCQALLFFEADLADIFS